MDLFEKLSFSIQFNTFGWCSIALSCCLLTLIPSGSYDNENYHIRHPRYHNNNNNNNANANKDILYDINLQLTIMILFEGCWMSIKRASERYWKSKKKGLQNAIVANQMPSTEETMNINSALFFFTMLQLILSVFFFSNSLAHISWQYFSSFKFPSSTLFPLILRTTRKWNKIKNENPLCITALFSFHEKKKKQNYKFTFAFAWDSQDFLIKILCSSF